MHLAHIEKARFPACVNQIATAMGAWFWILLNCSQGWNVLVLKVNHKIDPKWSKTSSGKFHRLLLIDADAQGLSGLAGIVALWRGGLRPTWLFFGRSNNIAADLERYLDNDDIMEHDTRGGVFVSWTTVRPEYQDGVLKYLLDTMDPLVENPKPPQGNIPTYAVLAPGEEPLPEL